MAYKLIFSLKFSQVPNFSFPAICNKTRIPWFFHHEFVCWLQNFDILMWNVLFDYFTHKCIFYFNFWLVRFFLHYLFIFVNFWFFINLKKRDSIVENIIKTNEHSEHFRSFFVPSALLETLDSNQNPKVFTKSYLEHIKNVNCSSSHLVADFMRFRALLLLESAKVFPEDVVKYRELNPDLWL